MTQLPDIPAAELARTVVRTLREAGHHALLAGGCVRDLLMGRDPRDYDVATGARPEQVEELFEQTVPVGKAFGVIIVTGDLPGLHVEVATFRRDGPYADGRRPDSVTFTDAKEDAARRDFTVNALFLDPETGEVTDYVGGVRDIERKRIRAVGEPSARFTEDKLRLLRAVRFAATLGFEIETPTLEAIGALASQVTVCSAERISGELTRLLHGPGQSRGFRLMFETGLLDAILPEISAMSGVAQPPEHHPEGDVFTHTMLLLDLLPQPCSLGLALGALLHDVAKPATFDDSGDRIRFHGHDALGARMSVKILRRLKFPAKVVRRVESLVLDHLKFFNVRKMKTSTLKRFLRGSHIDELLELHRIDCLAGSGDLANYEYTLARLKEFNQGATEQGLRPKLPIDGKDLLEMGLEAGPQIGEILRALEDEMLEGRVAGREQALEFARGRAGLDRA